MKNELVLILDFGSQYTQLIAKVTRKLGVYSEIVPYNTSFEEIIAKEAKALIFSGSPFSVNSKEAPFPDKRVFEMGLPILGICYGMQLLGYWFDGVVERSLKKEYGNAQIHLQNSNSLFVGLEEEENVWMSHGDSLAKLPESFNAIAKSDNSHYVAMQHKSLPIYGLQFHPEVTHTPKGRIILDNFLKRVAGFQGTWSSASFIEQSLDEIRSIVGKEKVLLALSGGVDSSVTAALLDKAIGDQLYSVFVDTGLMRKAETSEVKELFSSHWSLQ